MKSWLAQGSLGRQVTLLPRTTFLHIKGAYVKEGWKGESCLEVAAITIDNTGAVGKRINFERRQR